LEIEFLMSADFVKMRSEFMKVLQTAPNPNQPGQQSGPQKIELDTCISNFARPETLEGSNKWHCEKCN
jgi:hypothetical protein